MAIQSTLSEQYGYILTKHCSAYSDTLTGEDIKEFYVAHLEGYVIA